MAVFRPPSASCTVRVFKAGILSAVGHDLELRVTRFSLQLEDGVITAEFDGTSLEVAGAIENGRVLPHKLSTKDQRDILANIRKSVWARRDPRQITFTSDDFQQDDEGLEGTGTLSIPPYSHDLDFEVEVDEDRAVCAVTLHQPDYGITPFKAPLGVLRIQPDIQVRIELPWEG